MPRVKKEAVVKSKKVVAKPTIKRSTGLSVPVYSLTGRAAGSLTLPKEIFGVKVNKSLLSQAIRVYTTNQKNFLAKTKTRGEVEGSTAKIWRQKGTGRARHGGIRAPIFVGGGIVFGPKVRKVRLELPKGMKKVALISALSAKMEDKGVLGLSGLDKATGKTKEMFKLLTKINGDKKVKSTLIVVSGKSDNVVRAVKNISGVNILSSNMINAYEVLRHEMLLITKDAVETLAKPKEQK